MLAQGSKEIIWMTHKHPDYSDALKILIYEDYLRSIALVRAGADPDVTFREHEARVYRLRMLVAATEALPVGLKLVC
jgi:hypothetical protein